MVDLISNTFRKRLARRVVQRGGSSERWPVRDFRVERETAPTARYNDEILEREASAFEWQERVPEARNCGYVAEEKQETLTKVWSKVKQWDKLE